MIPTLRILLHMRGLQLLAPFWLLGLVLFIWQFSPLMIVAVIYGAVLQFLVEYSLHRFVYHREPPSEQSIFNALYRSHIGHHEFPDDPEFFTGDDPAFALRFGVGSAVIHSLILWPFLGIWGAAEFSVVALFLGSVSAFAFYEYCHTIAHLNVPKGWFGRRVTRSHLAHHYTDHHATFHVSLGMGWIDRLFGTPPDREKARERYDRKTILSLGMDPEDLRLVTARKTFGITKTPRNARS